jgi:hypothetical protein
MIPWHRLIVTAGLTSFAVGILAPIGADDRPLPVPSKVAPSPEESPEKKSPEYPPNATDAEKRQIDLLRVLNKTADAELRKKLLATYPFESLEDRLKFDAPGRKRVAKSFPTGDLDLGKWKPLVWTEEDTKIPPAPFAVLMAEERLYLDGSFRMKALAVLHQLETEKFVTNPGFGNGRMRLQVRDVPKPEKPPTDWSEGDRGEPVNLPKAYEKGFFNPSRDKKGPTLPSVRALFHFHNHTAYEFARPDSWGLVKDKTQVAGFLPHTLEFVPEYGRRRYDPENPTKDKDGEITGHALIERWVVRKVELIGLLMHDAPVVYLNPENKLPTMAGARDSKTRALTEFESGGLRDLSAGKEIVVVDATTNQIRMVGAIRMASACTKCHEGARGDLLGAFTYELIRDPAFIPPQK